MATSYQEFLLEHTLVCPNCNSTNYKGGFCRDCHYGLNEALEPLRDLLNQERNMEALTWMQENCVMLELDKQVKEHQKKCEQENSYKRKANYFGYLLAAIMGGTLLSVAEFGVGTPNSTFETIKLFLFFLSSVVITALGGLLFLGAPFIIGKVAYEVKLHELKNKALLVTIQAAIAMLIPLVFFAARLHIFSPA